MNYWNVCTVKTLTKSDVYLQDKEFVTELRAFENACKKGNTLTVKKQIRKIDDEDINPIPIEVEKAEDVSDQEMCTEDFHFKDVEPGKEVKYG